MPSSFWNGTLILVSKIHSLKPHLWCCRTPSAFPPLSHRSYPMGQRGPTSHPQTPAAGAHPHPSPGASLLRYHLLVSLLAFCPGFVLSNDENKQQWGGIHTNMRMAGKHHILVSTDLSITFSEMLDKLHQVCWVSDDFKVEFFNWKTLMWGENSELVQH